MPKSQADEFGRYRVVTDTGAKISIQREPFPSEKVLDEPASDVAGDALPVEYPAPKSAAKSTTNSGQQADPEKENADG